MYPSKTPLLFVLHFLVVFLTVITAMVLGMGVLKNPMAILAVFGLFFLPSFPVMEPPQESEPEPGPETGVYDGSGRLGFGGTSEE